MKPVLIVNAASSFGNSIYKFAFGILNFRNINGSSNREVLEIKWKQCLSGLIAGLHNVAEFYRKVAVFMSFQESIERQSTQAWPKNYYL